MKYLVGVLPVMTVMMMSMFALFSLSILPSGLFARAPRSPPSGELLAVLAKLETLERRFHNATGDILPLLQMPEKRAILGSNGIVLSSSTRDTLMEEIRRLKEQLSGEGIDAAKFNATRQHLVSSPIPKSALILETASTIKIDLASLPYKLAAPNGVANSGYWSQSGQDKIVDQLLEGRKGLFFIESGGYDGELHSNSLFFEHRRGWQGMVIEPNPHLYKQILNKNRRCMTVNAAISPNNREGQLPFVLAGPLGGFVSTLSDKHSNRLRGEIAAKKKWMAGELGSGGTIMVPSYPPKWFLVAGNQPTLVVDYWSLDTEGSEPQILMSTNFTQIQIGVMSIEHNTEPDKQKGIREAMMATGLVLYRNIGFDYIYVNPAYFRERGLKPPV